MRAPLVVLMLAGLSGAVPAAASTSPTNSAASLEQARVERLAGLGRAWGLLKYFHPRLAEPAVDWDLALVNAVPKVDAARDAREYAAALEDMASVLHDGATRFVVASTVVASPDKGESPPAARREGMALVLDIRAAKRALDAGKALPEFVEETTKPGPDVQRIVIDLRTGASAGEDEAYETDRILRALLPKLLARDARLPGQRERVHSGLAPQRGQSSGGYYSSWRSNAPEAITGEATIPRPIVVVVNEWSLSGELVRALQASGQAQVLQEGAGAPLVTTLVRLEVTPGIEMRFPEGEVEGLADGATLPADRRLRAGEDAIAVAATMPGTGVAAVVFPAPPMAAPRPEADYAEMLYPARGYRLLALFRYWNAIRFFYPYKDLIGEDWEAVLPAFIPRFEAARDAYEYQSAVRQLSTHVHDNHAFLGPTLAFSERVGPYTVPVLLRHVEGQSVVVAVLASDTGLRIGDAILEVDGQPIPARRAFFQGLYSNSTPQAALRTVQAYLLRGAKGSQARLRVRAPDGKEREVLAPRSIDASSPSLWNAWERKTPVFEVLPGDIGYADLDRLLPADVDAMFEKLKDTRAIVFDMRGYPNGTAWPIAARLGKLDQPAAAIFSRPQWDAGWLDEKLGAATSSSFVQTVPPPEGARYGGRVFVLINEDAVSQSEHSCLLFEAATKTTFVGSPTTGANGDVTNVVLPGGIVASFSGHSVRHADGRQLQRVGILPDIAAAPTIGGIAAGRDEVLERALQEARKNR